MKLSKIKYSLKKAYKQSIGSISFYPVLIALTLLLLSGMMLYLDQTQAGSKILNQVPFLRIDNANTARTLLSSLLTGLISLVTFTFTMIMVVLTQVVSSFSPRLLPDLLHKRGNQIVLGTIMGTIFFLTVVLSKIQTYSSGPEVPVLSVLTGTLLGLISLFSYIYFIHKISNEIEIGNILNNLQRTTRQVIEKEKNSGLYSENPPEQAATYLVKAWESGHFDTITEKDFLPRARQRNLSIKVLKHQGMYLLKGDPFLEINQPLTAEIQELLEENILLRHQELVGENFFYGFKHLTEIAVKALSPAINDPGTAIHAIDYLMDLFSRLQQLRGCKVIRHPDGSAAITYAPIPFAETFYLCLASIRAYSAQDVTVQARLITLISRISAQDEQNHHRELYRQELEAIEEASAREMKSQHDLAYIRSLIRQVRQERMT